MAIPDQLAGIPEQVVPQKEREEEGPWTGVPPPPTLSPLGSARPRAEGKSDAVMPAAECVTLRHQRRGERATCSTRNKTTRRGRKTESRLFGQHPGEPPRGLLFCSLRSGALYTGEGGCQSPCPQGPAVFSCGCQGPRLAEEEPCLSRAGCQVGPD